MRLVIHIWARATKKLRVVEQSTLATCNITSLFSQTSINNLFISSIVFHLQPDSLCSASSAGMNNRPSDTPFVRETPSQSRGQVVDDSRYKPKGGIISTNEFPCTHTCLDLPSGEGTSSSPIGTNLYGTQHDIVGLNRTCIPLHALSRESNSINRYKRTAYVNDQQTKTKLGKAKLEAHIHVNGRGVCTPPSRLTHGVGAEAGENPLAPITVPL